jgi:hypothetical protein
LGAPRICKKDTQDDPDSARPDNLQAETQATPDAHLNGEGGGKERRDQIDRCEASLKEAEDSALKSASFVGIEQHDAQPLVQDEGKKRDEGNENERIDRDDEDGEGGEQQTEQIQEEEGASSAHGVEGSDDGEREAPETPYIEPEPISNEERLQEDARGYRAFDSTRIAGGVNNAHDAPSTDELVDVQGTASPSKTSVMPVSLSMTWSLLRGENWNTEWRLDRSSRTILSLFERMLPKSRPSNRASLLTTETTWKKLNLISLVGLATRKRLWLPMIYSVVQGRMAVSLTLVPRTRLARAVASTI